jgi:hypothetical protein
MNTDPDSENTDLIFESGSNSDPDPQHRLKLLGFGIGSCFGTRAIFCGQGVAASGLPTRVFAVIDMYGKCAQVSNGNLENRIANL